MIEGGRGRIWIEEVAHALLDKQRLIPPAPIPFVWAIAPHIKYVVPNQHVGSPGRRPRHGRAAKQHAHLRRAIGLPELVRPSGVDEGDKPVERFSTISV